VLAAPQFSPGRDLEVVAVQGAVGQPCQGIPHTLSKSRIGPSARILERVTSRELDLEAAD
jgi:hypothetical protein